RWHTRPHRNAARHQSRPAAFARLPRCRGTPAACRAPSEPGSENPPGCAKRQANAKPERFGARSRPQTFPEPRIAGAPEIGTRRWATDPLDQLVEESVDQDRAGVRLIHATGP